MKNVFLILASLSFFPVFGDTLTKKKFDSTFMGLSADFGIPSPLFERHIEYHLHQGVKLSVLAIDGDGVHTHQHGLTIALVTLMQRNVGIGLGVGHWVEDEAKGIQIGLVSAGATKAQGLQIGAITGLVLHSFQFNTEWTEIEGMQLGLINLAEKSWLQFGLYNHVNNPETIQLGLWNHATQKRYEIKNKSHIQFGILNTTSCESNMGPSPSITYWQFGILNKTSSGWWLPISNFGL